MLLEALPVVLSYLWRILPVVGLFAAWLACIPRPQTSMRVLVLIFAFVCIRDMMTPSGLWAVGGEPPLRFHANPWVLTLLGVGSIALTVMVARWLPRCWGLVVASQGNRWAGMTAGLAAGCAIGLPVRLYLGLEQAPWPWLLGFAFFAYAGNALEEVLFRGMLQGQLQRHTGAQRAALGSACAFAASHGYLAFVVTGVGWPIVLFTFVEGFICAQVRLRFGTWPAAATHGTVILLIGSQLS